MSLSEDAVNPNEIFVNTVTIHFGQKEKDPVKSVIFCHKTADQIGRDDVSRMLPANLTEQYVCVYGKDRFDKKEVVMNCF